MDTISLVPFAEQVIPAWAVSGERLKSRTVELAALCTYEAAMVSIESGSAGGQ